MNSVILIGRLARDPELSYTANTQTAMCRFTIAVDRPRRQGEDQGADFIRITVWGRQAESCDRYLSKGRQVAVMGRIQTGSYKDRNGETVYTTDVVAERVEFLGGSQESPKRSELDETLSIDPQLISAYFFKAKDSGTSTVVKQNLSEGVPFDTFDNVIERNFPISTKIYDQLVSNQFISE